MKRLSHLSACALLAATIVALSGCKNNSQDKAPYASDSTGNGSTATTVPGDTTANPSEVKPGATDTASAAPAALTDANIFAKLDAANAEEVDEGKLGSEKAKNAGVKKFAQMLVTDHGKMRQKGGDLAKSLNIAPQLPPGDTSTMMAQHTMQTLNAANGAAFDSVFLATEVDGHQKTLDELNKMQGMATSDSLKALISSAIPIVQHHLDEARSLQSKASGSKPMAGDTSKKR